MHSLKLLSSAAAVAMVAAAGAAPAMAQVADPELVIEGKINEITANSITVMGIKVNVPAGKATTPTKEGVPLLSLTQALPGRPQGFLGGTAIVTGGSVNGVVTASDVFSDVNENVIVGEATTDFTDPLNTKGLTVNFKEADPIPATNAVIPAGKVTNIFGFTIDPNTIDKGSLVSVEGYEGDDGKLYYHNLEADTGRPVNATTNEVGISRANCRDRAGTGKDELEVRGAVHLANMVALTTANRSTVTVTFAGPGGVQQTLSAGAPVVDPATPTYGEFRVSTNRISLSTCPLQVKVSWLGDTDAMIAGIDTAAEAR